MLAPRDVREERDTERLSPCFLHILVPLPPQLDREVGTYLVAVGFEFSRWKVLLSGKMSD